MLFSELVVVRQDALGFGVFTGEHLDMGFQGIALYLQLLIFPAKRPNRFHNFAYFRFNFFGFGHESIILLEVAFFQIPRLITNTGLYAEKNDLHGRFHSPLAAESLSLRSQMKTAFERILIPRFRSNK